MNQKARAIARSQYSSVNFIFKLMMGGLVSGLLAFSACTKKSTTSSVDGENLVVAGLHTDKTITTSKNKLRVMSSLEMKKNFPMSDLRHRLQLQTLESKQSSLVIEIPLSLLNENYIFGGVVTRVLDPKGDETLGDLKLANYKETLAKLEYDKANKKLKLLGCAQPCSENAQYNLLIEIPVAMDYPQNNSIFVDFSQLDHELDIVQNWNRSNSNIESHEKKDFLVSAVDYSLNTLVLETNSHYERSAEGQEPYQYQIYTRWFLKLTSGFDPLFQSRELLPSVGYFDAPGTKESSPRITRFSIAKPIKYYIKNVPQEFRKAFSDALNGWNVIAEKNLGHAILDFEYLEPSDPRFALIVPGDIRYNVIEWDTETIASYGGLGPSFAHPVTGETFSGDVLVQGPVIIDMYKEWFKLGQNPSSQQFQKFYHALNKRPEFKAAFKTKNKKIKNKYRYIRTTPELYDARFQKRDFDLPPVGVGFDDYMYGYFYDMVAHEMGHNLGLRHNFRGNLSSDDSMTIGSVSRSVMEYLGRPFRYLDRHGDYDAMAISYGYKGEKPAHEDWYCTDEDELSADPQKNSAECRSDDAGSDPFKFYMDRLSLAYKMIANQGSDKASTWTNEDITPVIEAAADGIIGYATSAETTASKWTNFFGKSPARPDKPELVPAYVAAMLNTAVCNSDVTNDVAQKATEEDRAATQKLINDFQQTVAKRVLIMDPNMHAIDLGNFACITPPPPPFEFQVTYTVNKTK